MKKRMVFVWIACVWLVAVMSSAVFARTVTLAWDPNTEPDIAGYKIYYRAGDATLPLNGTGAAEGPSPVDIGMKLSATLSNLSDGQPYYFAVTAYNSAGYESSFSNIISSPAPTTALPVNQPPVLSPIGSKTVAEGVAINLTVAASDPDGNPLTFSASGLPAGATFNPSTRFFSWTPNYNQAGSHGIVFTASDGTLSTSENVTVTVTNTNRTPLLTPIGGKIVYEGSTLLFTVDATDPDGDSLAVTSSSLPSGAVFTSASRTFSWTPPGGSSGSYLATFAVSDGSLSASETVSITVQPPRLRVRASAGTGGTMTPSGDIYLQSGASQIFTAAADTGYVIHDLRVDGLSIGPKASYTLANVTTDRTVEAVFKAIPPGLSYPPGEAGIPGVERADGGGDGNNYVAGQPSPNFDFIFRVVYQDPSIQSPLKIYLKLNGYAYEMTRTAGDIGTGALFTYKTRLGPAPVHKFHFEARDPGGNVLYALPQQGEITGPVVELLGGRNLIGVPGDSAATYLNSTAALGTAGGYRWVSGGLSTTPGKYRLIDATGAIKSGEGYLMKRETRSTLPEPGHPEIAAPTFTFRLKAGWNLISSPYRGNIPLAHARVRRGTSTPVSWTTAAANGWVTDALYLYQGNASDIYGFETAVALQDPVMVPWVGYWVYVKKKDAVYSLIFPKPLQ